MRCDGSSRYICLRCKFVVLYTHIFFFICVISPMRILKLVARRSENPRGAKSLGADARYTQKRARLGPSIFADGAH